jgi:metal-sulfur cluster biosynthetic enzyme
MTDDNHDHDHRLLLLASRVRESLNEVVEEETTRKLGELNIISEVQELPGGAIVVKFTPLSPYSPTAVETGRRIREAALSVEGVTSATVESNGHMQDDLVNKLVNRQEKKKS